MSSCVVCFNKECTCLVRFRTNQVDQKEAEIQALREELKKTRALVDIMADKIAATRYK